jgi:mono/diheme cytochrome c family protein
VAFIRRGLFPAILILLAALLQPIFAPRKAVRAADAPAQRGKYIVDDVAKCVECHTPRDESGNLRNSAYLRGAPIPVNAPPYPKMNWALQAPNIAGLPGYTVEQGMRLLTEGVDRNGRRTDPPMPQFRMTPEDARAVVNYLKSLE